ncbi:hybrid sensor histidine kinase/response regulator [Simiduia curdlanivorans]|uniref:histidine kinase n=1 Tax=Simiduia curdlanivorans TaxID=1492769 RepID=A0ABV8V3X8_9GAMM|nr:hybrid sensor histidine kinase/response regulator [Simiduia curdlanivorans]MDN3641017.1 hybrid sensor histidine kinase/response regulator [Simiduia curdlanivorans]
MNTPIDNTASFAAKQEMLHLLARQSGRVPFGKIPAILLIAALAWMSAPKAIVAGWACAALAVLMLRWLILSRIDTHFLDRPQTGLNLSVWLSLINGLVMACSLMVFPFIPEVERAVHTLILMGLCTGAIATTAGHLPLFLSYAAPIALPLVIIWGSLATPNQAEWIGPGLAVLIAMFFGLMISLARDTSRLYLRSFQIRSEQSELNSKLQQALNQAEMASHTKTRFLASASHDLRQPIHTLSLFSAALIRRDIDTKSKQIASHMDNAIQALAAQLDTLLDISKLEAGVVDVNIKTIDIHTLLSRLFEEHIQSARQKNLHLGINGLEHLDISTDPILLERIIRNLLSNAIKYTDKGGVDLNFSIEDRRPCIEVIDSGQGIPSEEQAKIFEEFYQLNNPERNRSKGLGLGLAIVKRLTKLIDIDIDLRSSPGKGTRIRLLLPSSSLQSVTHAPREELPQLAWQNIKVLVVDDEADALQAMSTLLQELSCQVSCAHSTQSALKAARVTPPDVLLADVDLNSHEPDLNLIDVFHTQHPSLPIILVGGQADTQPTLGAEATPLIQLQKPVTLETLTQAIRQSLAKV